ncbi:MAG: serine hydrolase domain-containing protein [Chitinophagaceae bacterium]
MKSFLLLCTILLHLAGNAQNRRLDSLISAYCKANHFSGNILISQNGQIIYRRSWGEANITFHSPIKTNTRFKVASITKLFTAVLTLQLQEQGKLDLEKTISTYLPGYTGQAGSKATLHQLLNHTSGLPNIDTITSIESALRNGMPVYQLPHTTDELLEKFCSGNLVNTPGANFDYNNADFIILGKIIEQVTGKTYEQALKENILVPLRLKNTGMLRQDTILPLLADSYFIRDASGRLTPDLPVYMENWYAAGALYSTTGDLLTFSDALFSGKLINDHSLKLLCTSGKGEYGLGTWIYNDYTLHGRNYTILKRPGSIMGAQAVFLRVLEKPIAIIVLSNTASVSMDDFGAKLLEWVVK